MANDPDDATIANFESFTGLARSNAIKWLKVTMPDIIHTGHVY